MEELLGSPLELAVSLILGAVSFVMMTAGLRAGRLSWALWGVALGVPSYAPGTPMFWGIGAAIGLLAWKAGQLQ